MRLRIVTDYYLGYEVQAWRWWWPFWIQANFSNTHMSLEQAEGWAKAYANKNVVKYVDLASPPAKGDE